MGIVMAAPFFSCLYRNIYIYIGIAWVCIRKHEQYKEEAKKHFKLAFAFLLCSLRTLIHRQIARVYCVLNLWRAIFSNFKYVCCVDFALLDVVSSLVFNLEDNLPDELVSGGSNWADTLGGNNKPSGPPGNNQMNGEDPTGGVPNVAWNQHQRPGKLN